MKSTKTTIAITLIIAIILTTAIAFTVTRENEIDNNTTIPSNVEVIDELSYSSTLDELKHTKESLNNRAKVILSGLSTEIALSEPIFAKIEHEMYEINSDLLTLAIKSEELASKIPEDHTLYEEVQNFDKSLDWYYLDGGAYTDFETIPFQYNVISIKTVKAVPNFFISINPDDFSIISTFNLKKISTEKYEVCDLSTATYMIVEIDDIPRLIKILL